MENGKYSLFDNMREGAQVIDQEWKYAYVNEAVVEQSKTTKEALLGHTMMELYPGIEQTQLFLHVASCMEQRTPCQMMNKFQFPDGSMGWFDLRIVPVEEGVLILSFDVSRQKQLEADLLAAKENLEKKVIERTAELFASVERERDLHFTKSRLLAIASHEFRTPLSTMLSSLNLLERYNETDDIAARTRHIEKIRQALGGLRNIMDDFLSAEKIDQGKMQVQRTFFDVTEFASELVNEMNGLTKTGQSIRYVHHGAKQVYLDPQVLRNMALNLLSNAVKYSDTTIDMQTIVDDEKFIMVVRDRGIGIPEEDKEHIFQEFFRAANTLEVQGTGLGLNIVKRYVELMDGVIDFDSVPGEGTTFTVLLPTMVNTLAEK